MNKKTSRIVIAAVLVILIVTGVLISLRHQAAREMAVQTAATEQQQQAASATTSPAPAKAPEKKTILIGQSGVVGDITVKIVSLTQDSRCPANVTCIQYGAVGVRTTLTKGSITTNHDFLTGTAPFAFEGYHLSITSVTPTPVSGQPAIPLSDYRITFMATPSVK